MRDVKTVVTRTIKCDICGEDMEDFDIIQVIRPTKIIQIIYKTWFGQKDVTIEDICQKCNSELTDTLVRIYKK